MRQGHDQEVGSKRPRPLSVWPLVPIHRLRAGLCDRCVVTQELARKKQLEFESSHLQSLQRICVLSELQPGRAQVPSARPGTGVEGGGRAVGQHGCRWTERSSRSELSGRPGPHLPLVTAKVPLVPLTDSSLPWWEPQTQAEGHLTTSSPKAGTAYSTPSTICPGSTPLCGTCCMAGPGPSAGD